MALFTEFGDGGGKGFDDAEGVKVALHAPAVCEDGVDLLVANEGFDAEFFCVVRVYCGDDFNGERPYDDLEVNKAFACVIVGVDFVGSPHGSGGVLAVLLDAVVEGVEVVVCVHCCVPFLCFR